MKLLYLIYCIIRDWLTVYKKYTVIVVITMIASTLALFFVATKNATENLLAVFEEEKSESRYSFEVPFDNTYEFASVYWSYKALDNYIKFDLPTPKINDESSGNFIGRGLYTHLNGEQASQVTEMATIPYDTFEFAPVFSMQEEKYRRIINSDFYEYEIIDGRYFTEEELKNHDFVFVADEATGFKTGDIITTPFYELEVIGVAKSNNKNSENYSIIPFWLVDDSYNRYDGPRSADLIGIENGYTNYPDFDFACEASAFAYEKPLTNSQVKSLPKVFEVDKSFLICGNPYYYVQVNEFILLTTIECSFVGVFCILNILLVIWFLCEKNIPAMQILRVYGASPKKIVAINLALIVALCLISSLLSIILCPIALQIFRLINDSYEWRFKCFGVALASLCISSVIAVIPAVIMILKKSPVGK